MLKRIALIVAVLNLAACATIDSTQLAATPWGVAGIQSFAPTAAERSASASARAPKSLPTLEAPLLSEPLVVARQ